MLVESTAPGGEFDFQVTNDNYGEAQANITCTTFGSKPVPNIDWYIGE